MGADKHEESDKPPQGVRNFSTAVNKDNLKSIHMERIDQEKLVVNQMIGIYCRKHHKPAGGDLCADCRNLLDYAHQRLDHCPKGNEKSSCRKCEIHCYSKANREKIREVMRYVGPRMLFIHPLSTIRHLISELK